MSNIIDKQYLKQKKVVLIDRCPQCAGLDLSCACYPRYFLEIAKAEAAIPIKYRNFSLSSINQPESKLIVASINAYVKNLKVHKPKGRGIYLWGNTGNAKTALASIILIEALKQGYTAYFTDLIKCMEFVTDGWKDEAVKANFGIKVLQSQFLVIDDVGKEYKSKTGFTEAHFDMIFRERANNLLPTILTSNLAPTEIATDYGKRLFSIFSEHLIILETAGADYRRKVLAKQNEKEVNQIQKETDKEALKESNHTES